METAEPRAAPVRMVCVRCGARASVLARHGSGPTVVLCMEHFRAFVPKEQTDETRSRSTAAGVQAGGADGNDEGRTGDAGREDADGGARG